MLGLFPAIACQPEPVADEAEWLEPMRLGGYVIVLRHGATTSDLATDPMSNPAKKAAAAERQLSEHGRAQAKAVGEAHAQAEDSRGPGR